ncbi:hypothetical protein SMC26_14075 [Actinomadura fulvescens]|uniref:Uncharacterized protein n=1 Tax=Actinomadura fulvescens TaxID=46160 RepID=A0ABN3Q2D7_9ACTN
MNTTDQRPRVPFEERLRAELLKVVDERAADVPDRITSTAARRFVRRRWLVPAVGAATLAATAAVVLPVLVPGGAPAAYAVEPQGDGTVRVEIKQPRDAARLERDLKRAGIPATVDYLPTGKTCRQPRFVPAGDAPSGGGSSGVELRSPGDGGGGPTAIFTFQPADFTKERSLVIESTGGEGVTGLQASVAQGAVSPCEPVDAETTPPGLGEDTATHHSGGQR